MWCEFKYIISAYFDILNKKEIVFEVVIPLLIGSLSFLYSFDIDNNISQINFFQVTMPFIGILLGFTLAALTLLMSNSKLQKKMKDYPTKRKVSGVTKNLYELFIVFVSYLIVCETILSIIYYVSLLFPITINQYLGYIFNSLFIAAILNILFSTIRVVTNMYFITMRKDY